MAIITLGAGVFLAIAFAWIAARRDSPMEADLYLGTGVLLVVGALVWGARLGDYNTFHLFFAGIAVFATPAAAVAVWSIWQRLRGAGRVALAIVVLVLCGIQLELGAALSYVQLQAFGPHEYAPVPEEVLTGIRDLPPDAKLAYACQPFEELAPWDARLLALDAHTGRRIVPMCFEADFFGQLVGGQKSADNENPLFEWAPQRALYPDANAQPVAGEPWPRSSRPTASTTSTRIRCTRTPSSRTRSRSSRAGPSRSFASHERADVSTLVSIVIPARNEQDNIGPLEQELGETLAGLPYDFEFIVIDNGSTDGTQAAVKALCARDPRWKYIRFSRDFGVEASLTAGYKVASGEAIVVLYSDLQDPPQVIPRSSRSGARATTSCTACGRSGPATRSGGTGWSRSSTS